MANNENRTFYWLKLKKDFFKRHDIRIIEDMPNGKDYVLFYVKLLCESVDHEGCLRFSDHIPYNDKMLATITNTNIDIVRSAIKVFTELQLMEMLDDETIYMSEVKKMMGYETKWAQEKREYRERIKNGQCPDNVLPMSNKSKSIEIEIEKEIELDIDREKETFKEKENENIYTLAKFLEDLQQLLGYTITGKNGDIACKLYEEYGYKTAMYEIKKNIDKQRPIGYTYTVLTNNRPKNENTQSGSEWWDKLKEEL